MLQNHSHHGSRKKDPELIGSDVLKLDIIKHINLIKAKENNLELLRVLKASNRLKENHQLNYVESRKLPLYILPMVVTN